MILLVDVGNSRIKWRLQVPSGIHTQGSGETHGDLDTLFDRYWRVLPRPCRLLVSNVAGDLVAEQLIRWVTQKWHIKVELAFVSARACGVQNGYDNPEKLGVDRWLALIAVWNKFKAAACVADCGTAVTIDGLSKDGYHTGGFIMPGISLMHRCLAANAVGLEYPHGGQLTPMARNTRDAIWGGGVYAIAAFVDRIRTRLEEVVGSSSAVITGGHAEIIIPLLQRRFDLIPNLVLDGLAVWGETHR